MNYTSQILTLTDVEFFKYPIYIICSNIKGNVHDTKKEMPLYLSMSHPHGSGRNNAEEKRICDIFFTNEPCRRAGFSYIRLTGLFAILCVFTSYMFILRK